MLYNDPILDYDYKSWISNHIWLHKQPWFLWQISFFFSLFGVNEFILRLPTVLMFSLLVLIIYRIGILISNPRIAWFSAFFYTFSFFYVNYVSGSTFSDHNDSAFIFYISLSIWVWIKYILSRKRKWIILIGIFTGIAILNKWLAGLVVYSGWIVALLLSNGWREKIYEFKNMGISLLITLLIALPWQIYIFTCFPGESSYEFQMSSKAHL